MCKCCEFRLLLYDGPHCRPSAISTPMDFAVACEASQRLRCRTLEKYNRECAGCTERN
jgi:hypothetical protein